MHPALLKTETFPYPPNNGGDSLGTLQAVARPRASNVSVISFVAANRAVLGLAGLADVQSQSGGINVPVSPKQEETETGLGEDIQDTIEDSLRIGMDKVAALRDAPGDGVEEPQEDGENTAVAIRGADLPAQRTGVLPSVHHERVDDVEESKHAKYPVTPLVAGACEGAY